VCTFGRLIHSDPREDGCYGVKTIPGVREAVDAGNYARASEQAQVVIRALRRATITPGAPRE
jgi:hypothetical protein